MKRCFWILLFLVSCKAVTPALATTRYVSTTGTNAGTCTTSGSPCLTIAYGISQMAGGDTLLLCAGACDGSGSGTFVEQVDNTLPSGTSWPTATTLASFSGETITLNPTSGDPIIRIAGLNTKYIIISGLILDGSGQGGGNGIKITCNNGSSTAACLADEANHIRIQNNEIKNCAVNGINVAGGFNEFLNNHIHHNSTANTMPYGHGIYYGGSDGLIDGNIVHDNSTGEFTSGIKVYAQDVSVDRNVVRNNVVYNHAFAAGILLTSGTGNQAYNNLVYNNASGMDVQGNGALVYNNTFVSNTNLGWTNGSNCIGEQYDSNAVIQNNFS